MNSKRRLPERIAGLALFVIASTVIAADKSPEVRFPADYRSWLHVKSEFVTEAGKIYHFYSNPQAVDGYRAGKFPNGAILVRETLRTVAGEGPSNGMLNEGERVALDVMIKDDGTYKDTGGWGFATFDTRNSTATDGAKCYACHSKQKDHDAVFTTLPQAVDAGTPYPEGYRHWNFLHSSIVPANFSAFGNKPCVKPCAAGIFYFYANDKAMDGLRTGSYSNGSIIAEEMLEWLSTSNGGFKEGTRRVVGVMVKDSQRYASTGGWGYGSFDEGSRVDKLDAKARNECYLCHVSRKDQGYVFAEYRER